MPLKAMAPHTQARFQLTIKSYPSETCIPEVCEIVYDSRDKNLIKSLSGLPYIIGRSFPQVEVHRVHQNLVDLNVGHEFKNLVGDHETISFDPQAKKSEEKAAVTVPSAPTKSKSSLQWNNKTLWTLSLGLIVVTASGFLIKNYFSKKSAANISPIVTQDDRQATIEELTKDVEYRKHKDFIWQKAQRDLGLVEEDGVRTYENSSAVLRYREGTKVFVRPNTLIIIGREATSDRSIRLEDGTLQARLKPSATESKLAIETKAGTLEMKSPKIGEAAKEARIETKMSQGSLQIKVSEGSATLKPSNPTAQIVELKSREEIVATPTTVSSITSYIPTLELFHPKDGEKITVDPQNQKPINFQWENINEGLTYSFEIASDASMKNILMRQDVNIPEVQLHYLDPGPIFWRVTTNFEGITYQSTVQKLDVQEHHN